MNRIASSIFQIFSFETLFVFYLFGGQYKQDEFLGRYFGGANFTFVFFISSLTVGIFILFKKGFKLEKRALTLIAITLIFILYVALSLLWTTSNEYAMTKTLYLSFLNYWNLIAAALIIAPDHRRIRRFMFILLVFSLWYAVMALPFVLSIGEHRFIELTGSTYQGVTLILSMGIIVLISYLTDPSQNKLQKILSFLLCGIYLWILLCAGCRGYLLATIIPMFFILFINRRHRGFYKTAKKKIHIKKWHIALLLTIMVFGISLLLKYEKGTTTLYRLTLLSDPYHNPSSGIRISFLKSSLETWQKNPILGMGIGSWPVIMKYGDMRGYPHNIIIEVLLELGLVGLIFFLIFIGYALKTFFRRNVLRNPISLFVFLIFLTTFLEAMVSGDMTDHRFLYVSLGLMTLSTTPDRLAAPMPQKYMTGLWGYNKSQIKKHLLFPAKI